MNPSMWWQVIVGKRATNIVAAGPSNQGIAMVMGHSKQQWRKWYDMQFHLRVSQNHSCITHQPACTFGRQQCCRSDAPVLKFLLRDCSSVTELSSAWPHMQTHYCVNRRQLWSQIVRSISRAKLTAWRQWHRGKSAICWWHWARLAAKWTVLPFQQNLTAPTSTCLCRVGCMWCKDTLQIEMPVLLCCGLLFLKSQPIITMTWFVKFQFQLSSSVWSMG